MKKLFFIFLFFIDINVFAFEVKLDKCVDGDTARFFIDNKSQSVRFLAIDTPEMNTNAGKIAADYTCNKLKNAEKIELEYDPNSDKKDKYNRHLGWIFIDDELLQVDLVKNNYAKVAYLYGDYKYTHLLVSKEKDYSLPFLYISLIIILILFYKKIKQI